MSAKAPINHKRERREIMKVKFGQEFKTKSSNDFTKFSPSTGEIARICIIGDPEKRYVHILRKVIMDEAGQAIMETRETKTGRTYEVPKTDFVGKFICLGDEDTLLTRASDPENCPACRAAQETQAVEEAKDRYAVNILQYATNHGKATLKTPYQVSCKPWEFSQNRFNSLVDIAEEQEGLDDVDLIVKCINGGFQNLEITPGRSGGAEWKKNAETKKLTAEVLQADRMEDLDPLFGRTVKAHELESYVKDVVDQWDLAFNQTDVSESSKVAEDSDLASILGIKSTNEDTGEVELDTAEEEDDSEDDVSDIEDIASLLASLK